MAACELLVLFFGACLACRADDSDQGSIIQKRSAELPNDLLVEHELQRVKRLGDQGALVRVKRVDFEPSLDRVKRMKREITNANFPIRAPDSLHVRSGHRLKRQPMRQRNGARKIKHELIRRNVERAIARIKRHDAQKFKERALKRANKMNKHLHDQVSAYKRKHHIEGRFKREKDINLSGPKHIQPIHRQKKNGHFREGHKRSSHAQTSKHHVMSQKAKSHKIVKRKKTEQNLKSGQIEPLKEASKP
ncbi:hypothetical protein ScPMuIL_009517 [Solemya velum]